MARKPNPLIHLTPHRRRQARSVLSHLAAAVRDGADCGRIKPPVSRTIDRAVRDLTAARLISVIEDPTTGEMFLFPACHSNAAGLSSGPEASGRSEVSDAPECGGEDVPQ